MTTLQKSENPSWWTNAHESSWAKIRHSLQVSWDKATGTTGNGGTFHAAEPALRYGYGARMQHGGPTEDRWSQAEAQLEKEWSSLRSDRDWATARKHVLQGWNVHTRHITGEAIGTASVREGASGFGAGSAGDSGSGTGD